MLTLAYVFVPPFKGYAGLINLIGLMSPLAIAAGMRMHRPKAMLAWSLLLVGQLLYVAGDFYTYSYPALFGGIVGFPSAGDAIYLLVYPALFGGLLLLVRRRNPNGDRAAVIDSLILTVGFALLSWVFLVAPNIHLSGLSLLAKLVSVAYPLGDVLLLAALIRLAVDAGKRAHPSICSPRAPSALLATDCAYNYALLAGTYHHQLIYDVGWIAYLVLWGAAALHPSMQALEQPTPDARVRLTRARLGWLALACLIAPGIHFAQDIGSIDLLVVISASAGLFLLVVARMAGLVRQEERAASRESSLRQAGVVLVAAGGRENVNDAVVAAAARARWTDGQGAPCPLGRRRRARCSIERRRRLGATTGRCRRLRQETLVSDPVQVVAFQASVLAALVLGASRARRCSSVWPPTRLSRERSSSTARCPCRGISSARSRRSPRRCRSRSTRRHLPRTCTARRARPASARSSHTRAT